MGGLFRDVASPFHVAKALDIQGDGFLFEFVLSFVDKEPVPASTSDAS